MDGTPDMCLNGIVFADLSYKPGAYEVRNVQSPILIEETSDWNGKHFLKVTNHYHTLYLSHLNFDYDIQENGTFTEYRTNACNYLSGGLDTFTRAATGIDEGCHDDNNYYHDWTEAGLDFPSV